jgi:hypothetical protein
MKYLFKRSVLIFSLWLSMFLPCLTSCTQDTQPPKPPIRIPFAVHKAGTKIETDVRIVERHLYSFTLSFLYKDEADRVRVRKLTGGNETDKTGKILEPGVPIPVKVTIFKQDAEGRHLLFSQEFSEQRLYSWGGSLDKKIADTFLETGNYTISVESLQDIPELKDTVIIFEFVRTYQGK